MTVQHHNSVHPLVRHHNSETAPWFTQKGLTDRLVALHRDGAGFTTIARILCQEFQLTITKNQVIGKARRLALPQRGQSKPNPNPKPRKSRAKPRPPGETLRNLNGRFAPRVSVPLPAPKRDLVPLLPRPTLPRSALRIDTLPVVALKRDECKFPDGEYPYGFCGRPQVQGSYCFDHLRIVKREGRHD